MMHFRENKPIKQTKSQTPPQNNNKKTRKQSQPILMSAKKKNQDSMHYNIL